MKPFRHRAQLYIYIGQLDIYIGQLGLVALVERVTSHEEGADIKTIQELLRHANYKVTMDVYTQAVTEVKRTAQSRVARQIMGEKKGGEDEG